MKTIAVVEDDPDIAEVLTEALVRLDYRVVVASDGQEGLELVQEEHPDLVLSDVMMPRLGGVELARKVHLDPQLQDIPVILMSAGADLCADKGESYQPFVKKPFSLRELLQVVERQLGKGGYGGAKR